MVFHSSLRAIWYHSDAAVSGKGSTTSGSALALALEVSLVAG